MDGGGGGRGVWEGGKIDAHSDGQPFAYKVVSDSFIFLGKFHLW